MAKKKPLPGASIERSLIMRFARREAKKKLMNSADYNAGWTDAYVSLIGWLKDQSTRTNKKAGGLGKK